MLHSILLPLHIILSYIFGCRLLNIASGAIANLKSLQTEISNYSMTKILIVDNDKDILEVVTILLTIRNYSVETIFRAEGAKRR